MSLESLFSKRKVLITCGTGGVGKTTMSSALGMRAALSGRRSIVVTIDPAKRLATSLGLEDIGHHPTDLTPALRTLSEKRSLPMSTGTLSAIMPDTRKTLEGFIRSLAPSPAIAEKLISNPIFEVFSKEFSGANEYMALERLDALVSTGDYDCIVLDTPPSRNTLAFLKAPQLLARLFDEGLIKWLVLPANKILSLGMQKALGVLENLTGKGFISNLVEFAQGLLALQTTFTEKVQRVSSLLASEEVGFVLVTGPTPETLPELEHFLGAIREHQVHFDGLILNRSMGSFKVQASEQQTQDLKLKSGLELLNNLQNREARVIAKLLTTIEQNQSKAPDFFFTQVPELTRDVHSMEDLLHVAMVVDRQPLR